MAEYYPLLAKAVAGLPNSTPEIRRGVYERARKALLAQLQNLDPPLDEADVARETEALDGAVARLEAELAGLNGHAAEKTQPAAAPITSPDAAITPVPKPPSRTLPPLPPASRAVPPLGRQAGPAPARNAAPSAPTAGGPPLPPLPPTTKAPAQPAPDPAELAETRPQSRKAKRPPQMAAAEAQPDESVDSFEDRSFTELPKPPRAEGMRLYAPQQQASDEGRSGIWLWVVGGVVAVVVAIVAVAAWTLRDRPSQIAHLKPPPTQPEKAGKIVARIGAPKPPPAKPAEPSPSAGPTNQTAVAAAPAKPNAPATTAAAPAAEAAQTVPVAQRAALLVQAPDEPNKVKTYVGTVIWRLENVSGGAGQPPGTAVHADIDVPGDKMKVALTLQKNTDATLPASHTITVVFTVQPDSPTGGVKQISVPQLRQDDAPTGDPLIGIPVPIMANSFLIGLTRGNAESTNLDLIKNRAWFDIPILLTNGKIAKLTFEKAASGTRAIDEAIAAWKGQSN